MCRIEERVYIAQDGTSKTFEESFPCDRARKNRLCSNVTRKVIRYHSQPPLVSSSRDGSSSPAYPPTPTDSGTILVQKREPVSILRRPSTKDGKKVIEPKIVIEFGKKKDKSKTYDASGRRKRSSLISAVSVDDVAVESPGSDASYTVKTGFPETTTDSLHRTSGYSTRTTVPTSHHRHTSSASSFTTSSQPPSLYATSDPESASGRQLPRYPPPLVHNPIPGGIQPSSPTVTRAPAQPPAYQTTVHTPRTSRDNVGPDGVFPIDYSGLQPSPTTSGRAPEIFDRDADRARLRAINAEQEKRRLEARDREYAEEVAAEEARQARIETGRYVARDKERKEKSYAEWERRKYESREEERERKNQSREQEARDPKKSSRSGGDQLKEEAERRKRHTADAGLKRRDSKKEKDPRPIVRDPSVKHRPRRNSVALEQEISKREHEIALIEDHRQMARERAAAEQREADEHAAALKAQQAQPGYWDPRGGDRYPVPHENPAFGRRNSITGRRPSITAPPVPITGLSRTNSQSRRVSIHQSDPPRIDPSYSMRPQSSQRQHAPPPVSFPSRSGQSYSRPTSSHGNPAFGENPFQTTARNSPPVVNPDPWDARNARDPPQVSSSHHRQSSEDHENTLHRRGKDVIARAAREASRKMGKVVGFEDDYYEGSSSENSEDRIFGQGPRLGLGQKPKRKH